MKKITREKTNVPAVTIAPKGLEPISVDELAAVVGGEPGNYYERGYSTTKPGT